MKSGQCLTRSAFAILCLTTAANLAQAATGRAIIGEPFGVAEITIDPGPAAATDARSEAFSLSEAESRVLAPVFSGGRLREALGGALGAESDGDRRITVM